MTEPQSDLTGAPQTPSAKVIPTAERTRRHLVLNLGAIAALTMSLGIGIFVDGPTMWGFLPIAAYAILAIAGMDLVVATVVAIISALLILTPTPGAAADLLGESVGDTVTMIGLIIVLGAGLGEVMRITGVAHQIVRSVMKVAGDKSPMAFILGTMLSCLVLVAALGTLAGALAIAVTLIIPMAARRGFTRSATTAMTFIGGGAGLAIAPFAGSNVALLSAADVTYLQYVLVAGGPLALLSIVMGLLIVPWMQRRTANADDLYDLEDIGEDDGDHPHARRATAAFTVTLLAGIAYAAATGAGETFPLLALPVVAIVTGLAGGLSTVKIADAIYRGAAKLIHILLLFWLLAVMFTAIDSIDPFTVILDSYGGHLEVMSPYGFAMAIALVGLVGVPGASAAEVVLLDKVFGELVGSIGVSAITWVIVLMFVSKADTYGPFPNGNMLSVMGLSRSLSLKNMMITGYLILVPSTIMFAIIMFMTTH